MKRAILTWFPEHGIEKIHGDDIDILGSGVSGLVVPYRGIEEGWALVEIIHDIVRVAPSLLKETEEPKYKLGALVQTKPPRTKRKGIVSVIIWHFEKGMPIYKLTIDGKVYKSRYFDNELCNA